MIHKDRAYSLTIVGSFAELAEMLTKRTWTPCSGFVCGSLTLLNDAFSPDGAQEYAVIRAGRQVESLTCSWMDAGELLSTLETLDRGESGIDMGAVRIYTHADGCCGHCA